MFESTAYILGCTFEDDETALYTMQRVDGSSLSSSSRHRHLTVRKQLNIISCSCKLFEFKGISCRHMLAYFHFKQIIHLPSEYILTRWTKSIKVDGIVSNNGQEINDLQDKSLIMRHVQLSQLASMVIDDACLTVECSNILLNEFEMVHEKIKEMNSTHNVVMESIGNRSSKETKSISNPTHMRLKGCGKRLKSSKEIQISKSRLYQGCGLRGQSHDKRNCPKLHSGSTMDGLNSDSESPNDEDLTSQAAKPGVCLKLEVNDACVLALYVGFRVHLTFVGLHFLKIELLLGKTTNFNELMAAALEEQESGDAEEQS
ncbi:hypothetical protein FNV43_RR21041 [Rhamnella rubrinervis]|uniref:Protein FAR1-RELATED SEQUENCE n=1 Tax=Rhamnella rubrinervis TaxID=2594499 RepID=A0A8K0GXI0_9ROSA|nr:hypothetical protein FNV43_RR21041 [Rhamnella rubrinervis]